MSGPLFLTQKQQKCPGGYFQKNGVVMCGTVPETLTLFQTKICDFPYPVVGVNIKREMVLSPNDEEVANSSKKRTQFKTRVHKPYPISDQNGRN